MLPATYVFITTRAAWQTRGTCSGLATKTNDRTPVHPKLLLCQHTCPNEREKKMESGEITHRPQGVRSEGAPTCEQGRYISSSHAIYAWTRFAIGILVASRKKKKKQVAACFYFPFFLTMCGRLHVIMVSAKIMRLVKAGGRCFSSKLRSTESMSSN